MVNFVQIVEKETAEDRIASILTAMEEIKSLVPEVILLYTSKGNIKLILKQVVFNPWN